MARVIAIGALGGSGTRALAQVLMEAGVFLGDDLNRSNDNLVFTRLFKDPALYAARDAAAVRTRLEAFRAWMEQGRITPAQARVMVRAARRNPTFRSGAGFYLRVAGRLLASRAQRPLWGWKEPNTQLWVREIGAFFDDLRYIHVVRHGLDMAFSANRHQLENWGHLYGLSVAAGDSEAELARKQLEYWIRSTRAALEAAARLRGGFLLVNHSRFCRSPREEVDRMLAFVGLELPQEKRQALYRIPRTPATEGRFRAHDLSIFEPAQLEFVREMGFEL